MADLTIYAGTSLTVKQPLNELFDTFVMEDGAQLIAEVDLSINAISASFGNGCVIDGSVGSGSNGSNQGAVPPQVNNCDSGYSGYPGQGASDGPRGFNITLQVGLSKLGSLLIRSNGGDGGSGGGGGKGGQGGGALYARCKGGTGGPGGPGGRAGNGGASGQITFYWSPLDSFVKEYFHEDSPDIDTLKREIADSLGAVENKSVGTLVEVTPANVSFEAKGGRAGLAGAGGGGGDGGAGATGPFGISGWPGGDPGGHGQSGSPGQPGANKTPIFQLK